MNIKSFTFLYLISSLSFGQFLQDGVAQESVKNAYNKLYNEEWNEANALLMPVYEKYKNHPVSHLIRASVLQMRYVPIEDNLVKRKEFLGELEKCRAKAEELLKQPQYRAEVTFYLLASHGYIAQVYHNGGDFLKAAYEGKKAYNYMKDGFELVRSNPEFNFTNGLYNYYREQYPVNHSEIKPIIIFFSKGSKSQGLKELSKARNEALFTKNEASFMLLGINLKYENNTKEALRIASELFHMYPRNTTFKMKYLEALIRNKQYNEAEKELRKGLGSGKGLFELAKLLFLAQIEVDPDRAKAYYAKAIKIEAKGHFVQDYKSMAYFGLAEEFYRNKELESARLMLKEAKKIAEYTWVKSAVISLDQKLK
jgi:tetratricopeptide (TPR) repeat protein